MSLIILFYKNYLLFKRNILKNLFCILFPPILIFFISNFHKRTSKHSVDNDFYDRQIKFNFTENIFEETYFNRDIAIISKDNYFANELIDFLKKKENGLCDSVKDCNFFIFSSNDKLENYLKSYDYKVNSRYLSTAIEIIKETEANDIFEDFYFNIYSNLNPPQTESFNLNPFMTVPSKSYYPQFFIQILHKNLSSFKIQKYIEFNLLPSKLSKNLILNTVPHRGPKLLNDDETLENIFEIVLSFSIFLAFMPFIINFTIRILSEKEKNQKLKLQRKGISELSYNFSWWLFGICEIFLSILLSSIFLNIKSFPNASFIYIFIILFLFIGNLLTCALCIILFFRKIRQGDLVVKMLYFSLFLFSLVIGRNDTLYIWKILFCFLPFVSFELSFGSIYSSRHYFLGFDLKKIFIIINGNSYALGCFFMLTFSLFYFLYASVFHKFIYDYIKRIIYRIRKRKKKTKIDNSHEINETVTEKTDDAYFEKKFSLNDCKDVLRIKNLSFSYESASELTEIENFKIQNLNLNIFSNEIVILLGENGSGKTTLLKCIMSEFDFKGKIYYNKSRLSRNNKLIYSLIEYDNQENILYDDLTIQEHIDIFSSFGIKYNKEEISALLEEIDLKTKLNCQIMDLSEGQKRKVSIILTIIVDSKIIILDEPTTGVDIISKKQIWDFLIKKKKERIIIITTHSIEEAEYLSDRLVIIKNGNIISNGTLGYLKNKSKYNLILSIIIKEDAINNEKNKENIAMLAEEIKKNIDCEIKSIVKDSLKVKIKHYESQIENINEFLTNNKEKFNIFDYYLSSPLIDDIFYDVNEEENSNSNKNTENTNNNSLSSIQLQTQMNINTKNLDKTSLSEVFISKKEDNKEISIELEDKQDQYTKWESFKINMNRLFFISKRSKRSILFEIFSCVIPLYFFFYFYIYFQYEVKINTEMLYNNLLFVPFYQQLHEEDPNQIDISPKSYFFNSENKDFIIFQNDSITNFTSYDDNIFNKYSDKENIKASIYIESNTKNEMIVYAFYSVSALDFSLILQEMIIRSFIYNEYSDYFPTDSNTFKVVNDYGTLIQGSKDTKSEFYLNECIFYILVVNGILAYVGHHLINVVNERIYKYKDFYILMGQSRFSYWMSQFIYDYLFYFIILTITIIPTFFILNLPLIPYIYLMLIGFGIFIFPFSYVFSYGVTNDKTGVIFVTVNILIAIMVFILSYIIYPDASMTVNSKFFFSITNISPLAQLIFDLVRLSTRYFLNNDIYYCFLLNSYVVFIIHFLLNLLFLYLIENNFFKHLHNKFLNYLYTFYKNKLDSSPETNPYVIEQILESDNTSKTLRLKNVSKVYFNPIYKSESCVALEKFYLSLGSGERFGLLGENGSGKTTCIKSITNQIELTEGEIYFTKYSVKQDFEKIRNFIGYCPQNISTLCSNKLKVIEIIDLYLLSYNLDNKKEYINRILINFNLYKEKNKLLYRLSGGNIKKVNLALTYLNRRRLFLLDEPFSGIDFISKRIIYKEIEKVNKYNLLLTTHSVEDAEYLCDKIGWMRKGNFQIIGTPNKLKQLYVNEYYIIFRINPYISKEILDTFKESQIKDEKERIEVEINEKINEIEIENTNNEKEKEKDNLEKTLLKENSLSNENILYIKNSLLLTNQEKENYIIVITDIYKFFKFHIEQFNISKISNDFVKINLKISSSMDILQLFHSFKSNFLNSKIIYDVGFGYESLNCLFERLHYESIRKENEICL